MRKVTILITLAAILIGGNYNFWQGKGYLLEEDDLRIISAEGSRRVPIFGVPRTVVFGSRPYVLTSQALFALDPAAEQVSTVFRLDRAYTHALAGANDRIYLLGGDALTVVGGSASRMSLAYTYGLPRLASAMFMLPGGLLFFTPATGNSAFTFNPSSKNVSNVTIPDYPVDPVMVGSVLVFREMSYLCVYNISTRQQSTIDVGSPPTNITVWKDKLLISTSGELILADPATSTILARRTILGIKKLAAIDSEDFATLLQSTSLVTVALPTLAPVDSFHASCDAVSAAYPFMGKPLYVCGDKLALPGGSTGTQQYLVQTVRITQGQAFALQVGALSDVRYFGPLMERLARQGLPYYTVEEGGLTKFRVGYFRTREEAERIRSFLDDLNPWIVVEPHTLRLTHSIHDMNLDRKPDAVVAAGDSVLVLTLTSATWIEVLKASQLPAPVTDVYLAGNKAYAELEGIGLRELVLPDQ